jgi:F-type H+-transporting ATPase subunit delta
MVGVETIARRYAAALADVVLKTGETEIVKSELSQWAAIIDSNAELHDALSNPSIAHAQKENVLESLIEKSRPSKTTANFLRVLLRNNRLTAISAVNERFVAELEQRSGIVTAEILSARELPINEKDELRSQLEKLTGKRVNMDFQIDQDLIGGVVTRIGSTVYDGSIRTKLDTLREQLAGA